MKLTRREWIALGMLVFAVAFSVRLLLIGLTPHEDYYPDVEIYRASGELILQGVNPYDFSDKPAIRSALRQEAHTLFVREDQTRWNYYTSGNLPLNLLFFAAVSAISDTPRFHRYTYAFFDSVLASLVAWFVMRCWSIRPGYVSSMLRAGGLSASSALKVERLTIGVLLVGLSPLFLKAGVVYPEDKGIEVLLIVATIACWRSNKSFVSSWVAAILLGLSIAFKGLGVFLLPLFIDRLLLGSKPQWLRSAIFAAVVVITTVVWLPPFWPGVVNMVTNRLALASSAAPQHASIWVF